MSRRGDDLERGRDAYGRRDWATAFEALERANQKTRLEDADVERLAWSAALCGRDEAFLAALERLHNCLLEAGDETRAARMAFWLGFRWISLGEMGRGGGWFARAGRLVETRDCVERGYLLIPQIHRHLLAGDWEAARALAGSAAALGMRFGDADLVAFTRQLEGAAALRLGRVEDGLALIDEAMVSVMAGEVSPLMAGLVYCSTIASCHEVFALDRAREWTQALSDWCDTQPELVTFTGRCMVHRAELMLLGGAWSEAAEQAQRACERFVDALDPEAVGAGYYQQAEIHRLRGERARAEHAYAEASRFGFEPQPGLALLRLQEGRIGDATSALQRLLGSTPDPLKRARYLPALIEILLELGELEQAQGACDELDGVAERFATDVLQAMAARARGALRLARGAPQDAVEPLRLAFRTWRRIGAHYTAARIRVLLANAYRALGDRDGAHLEEAAARRVFGELGATRDLEGTADGDVRGVSASRHGLTDRQIEVLRLVARGNTNKEIARALGLSEKTVDRHLSNIFSKIDVSSRSAATAFAYEHQLI